MSHPWDDYRTGRRFTLEVRDSATWDVARAEIGAFERAMRAHARDAAVERHGIPDEDVFLDALTKRVRGWGTLRTWAWLTVNGRALDLNRDRLWPWQLHRAMRGGMPPSTTPTPRTGGTRSCVGSGCILPGFPGPDDYQ